MIEMADSRKRCVYVRVPLPYSYHVQVVPSLIQISRKALGISTLLQAALPKILESVPQSYYENTMSLVEVSNNSSIISDSM